MEEDLKKAEEHCDPTNQNIQNREELKQRYELMYDYITQGAMIRSRVNWHEQGEKNNKYFLNLENIKKGRSVIRNLNINGTDNFTTDPKIIMKEIREFYSDLYSERKLDEEAAAAFLNKADIPEINEDLKLSCEGLLTVNETYNAL